MQETNFQQPLGYDTQSYRCYKPAMGTNYFNFTREQLIEFLNRKRRTKRDGEEE